MKKFALLTGKMVGFLMISLLLTAMSLQAADINVTWTASPGNPGYKMEYSTDNGTTWSAPKDVGQITPVDYVTASGTHLLVCTYLWKGLPDNGLIIIRVSAYNAVGLATRTDAGAWYNKSWSIPAIPGGVGIQ